jgi:TfoX/Sxy family transcriptional regulator of competence genes
VASDPTFVQFVVEAFEDDCGVTKRSMFGEFGLFSGGKMFAAVCDDQLFVKPTEGGRAYIGAVVEAPMYPGARPSFLIGAEIEDSEWLSELARITVRELPIPRRRKPKGSKPKGVAPKGRKPKRKG